MANIDATLDAPLDDEAPQPTQVAYRPRSKGRSIETVCPPTMATPMSISLDRVEAVTGQSIDEFVAGRLGINQETLFSRYAAEQIDSLSIAYLNQDRNRPTLIANDTGTGKGRIVSGVIAPVVSATTESGEPTNKIAVFITAKPDLYVDMLARDMVDTGIREDIKPFFTNKGLNLELTSPDGAVVGTIETLKGKRQDDEIQQLIDSYGETGTIGEYNCIFTTYDQLKEKGSLRRTLLETIAPNATFVLDECDLGGGASGPTPPPTKKQLDEKAAGKDIRSISQFVTGSVLPKSDAYVLLSATAFKDPHVLTRLLSPKSEIRETGLSQEGLAEKLVAQGIPGQQDFTNKLALSGELVRLEKSMEGITFQTEPVPVDLEVVDAASRVMAKLVQFDRAKYDAVQDIKDQYAGEGSAIQASDGSEGTASVDSVNFTSTAFNFQQQFLFFLKADAIAQRTIESIEAGRKPEIIFFNTMQAVIDESLSNKRDSIEQAVTKELQTATPDAPVPIDDIKALTKERYQEWLRDTPAPEITLDIGELLERQLDKCRMVTIKDAYGDRERHYLTDDELSSEAVALDNEIRLMCQNTDWSSVKISGVDAILQQVSEAGYNIAEMSGRSVGIDYSDGTPRVQQVDAAEQEVRSAAKNGYNNGEVDALITNITTGWSGHASRSVNDQRQREAILAQAHPDGNKLIQSLGRVNRVGQVDPAKHEPDWVDEQGNPGWGKVKEQHDIPGSFGLPSMTMVYADGVAYEERITANINRKMASLNANTTGSRSSGVQLGDVDFMNSYGDQVAWDMMSDDPELHQKLDFPLGEPVPIKEKVEGAMARVTGRSLLLPLDEQRQLFDALKQNFVEYIAQREAVGESPMESKTLDLKAKIIGRVELAPAASDSLFAGATYVEVVQARSLQKPYSPLEVANQIRASVGLDAVDSIPEGEFEPISEARSLGQTTAANRLTALEEEVGNRQAELDEKIAQKTARLEAEKPGHDERISELQTQLQAAKEVEEPDKKAVKTLEKSLKSEERSLVKLQVDTNTSDERYKKIKLSEQLAATKERLELCTVGQPVRIADEELGSICGIVTDVKRVEGVKNPLAGGAWKVKFAIADGARDLTLKLSDINTAGKCVVYKTENTTQYQPPFDRVPVHKLFDDLQKERFETRQVVTGNLLASPVGKKYINFTNSQDQVRQGLLLPRGYDIEKVLEKMPVVLKTRPQQEAFLQREGVQAKTSDEAMDITRTVRFNRQTGAAEQGLLIEVPSKRGAGQYYKDPDLMALSKTGEFEKSGKAMKAFVPLDRADDFLDMMARKFPNQNLAVFDERSKPTARSITGDAVVSVDWFKEDQPLDLVAQELEISAEGIAARIAVQKEQSQQKAQQERQNRAFQSGDLDAAKPEGVAQKQEVQHSDLEKLTQAFENHFASGGGFDRITDARKFAVSYLQEQGSDLDSTLTNKQVDESIEKSLVRVARDITQESAPLEGFDKLVELYDRQPNLSSRTSTSIINQQYSTPVPIGRLVQQLGDITPQTTVYEPTAGNGSLLSNVDPERAIVNELDPKRASELAAQGFEPTMHDATEYAPEKKSMERVVLNPPFGRVSDPETGKPKRWMIELDDPAKGTRPYETSAVDHAISFKALSAMQDDGKAVLVLGAPMEQKMGSDSRDTYNEGQTRSFFYTLYNNYNVTDHFTVAGELYGKQGTTFPIDVVVIEGRGKSDLELPAVTPPLVYRTWDELREVMAESVGEQAIAAPVAEAVEEQQSRSEADSSHSEPTASPDQAETVEAVSETATGNSPETLEKFAEADQVAAEPDESAQMILPAKAQSGAAEKNVAKLLHQAGLVEAIVNAPEEDFHLRIENEPYIPLVVERHGEDLYLTHYRDDYYDGSVMDGEMVFRLDQGQLTLQETAVQNPFTGGESRGLDRGFARTFSHNLLDQGFAEAAEIALAKQAAPPDREQHHITQSEIAAAEFLSAGNLPLEVLQEKSDFDVMLVVPDLTSRNQLEISKRGDAINFNHSLADGISDDHITLRFELSGGDLKLESTYIKDSDEFTPEAATAWIDKWAEQGFDTLLANDSLSHSDVEITELWREAGYQVQEGEAVAQPESEAQADVVAPEASGDALPEAVKATQPQATPEPSEQPSEQVSNVLDMTRKLMARHDPETAAALSQPSPDRAPVAESSAEQYSPSLKALRIWFQSAKELGRDTSEIAQVAAQVLEGSTEADKPVPERDPNFKNPAVTLAGETLETMKSDITAAREKRAVNNCQQILQAFGKPDPENQERIQFAKPNGDIAIVLDRSTHTLTAFSRTQDRTLLTAVEGKVEAKPDDLKYLDKRTSQFLEKTHQRKHTQQAAR